jgi:5-methyltetrahydropteroyltriglutamate--homocysteine methyltransferase
VVHTTVVGTYPRIGDSRDEQKLRRAIARLDKGEISEADLRDVEREVVRDVIREQVEAGIDVVTDGQVTWYDSQSHIARGLEGVEIDGLVRYFNTNTYYRQPVIRAGVAWRRPILADEWAHATSVSKRPVKAVLTGPVTLATLAKDAHYEDRKALARAFSEAVAAEVGALVKAGASHIQIDEPVLARDPADLPLVQEALAPIASAKGRAELTLFLYFGDVAKIYSEVLKLPADVIGLDLVEGGKTWARVAKEGAGKPLVLGVVDARNTKAEDPEAIAAKIRELRKGLDLEASYLSPSNGLEFLPRDRAREKLAAVSKIASLVGGAS